MDTEPTKEQLIAYLYGELSADEQLELELWLKEHPDSMAEIEGLRGVRGALNEIKDKEVLDPFFNTGKSSITAWQLATVINRIIIKPAIGLAAAISLLILTAFLTGFNLNTEKGFLSISFGEQTPVRQNDSAELEQLVRKVLSEENVLVKSDLENIESEMNVQMASFYEDHTRKFNEGLNNSNESGNQALAQIVKQMQKDNLDYLERYLEISNNNQERYIQAALQEFSVFLADQREKDLARIQYNITSLKETQDLQKMETDQIFTAILNTVNTENKN